MFAHSPHIGSLSRAEREGKMVVISTGARLVRDRVLRAVSPSYRRVRARLAMIEAWRAPVIA
jgi:hypothetical protein